MSRILSSLLLILAVSGVLALSAVARDRDDDSDLDRIERRRGELFIHDDVLDPSFPPLDRELADDALRGAGNSDSVLEEPLDPEGGEDEELRKVMAGEKKDETDRQMDADHFDDRSAPMQPAPDTIGDEIRDPIEW